MSKKKVSFNHSQRLGLDIDRHIALDAGAGTGKTTVMAERYVQHLIASIQRSTLVLPHGPREPLSGHGSLRAPARERTDRKEWQGLLPSEVVAITFTKKAASELKARIRARVAATSKSPVDPDDPVRVYDPRIRSDADVEMLLSSLDEAPISTIDAFLSQLLSPHLDLVAVHPSREQIAQERAPLLIEEALHSAWRVRTISDAQEAGVLGYVNSFIEARDRISIALGGQEQASVVLSGMLNKSLFVEESKRSIEAHAHRLGAPFHHDEPLPEQLFLEMFHEPVAADIDAFACQLHEHLNEFVDLYLGHSAAYVTPAELPGLGGTQTRFRHLVHMARHAFPEDSILRMQWVWNVAIAAAGTIKSDGTKTSYFQNASLPAARQSGWHPGLVTKSKANLPTPEKDAIKAAAELICTEMSDMLNSQTGRLICFMGRSATLLAPRIESPYLPESSLHSMTEMDVDFYDTTELGGPLRIGSALQSRILMDLLRVHSACKDILAQLKAQEGVHDFDDIQNMAADLLLARCPDMVRFEYPPEVVDALDSLGNEPWTDHHISRALVLANDDEKCAADLQRRFHILQTLRRQYRAFIIDEYQDTNPAHFRLLARLWGHRMLHSGEPARPLGPWDPTICIVGDMKQSIYRFRQAEVSVMLRAVEAIREANLMESVEDRWVPGVRREGFGRDPRPIGAGGETAAFIVGTAIKPHETVSAPYAHLSLGEDLDGFAPEFSGTDRQQARAEGLIDLTSNYRTKPSLVHTMNGMFRDVFSERHHLLPGDWHASSQDLVAGRDEDDTPGVLEWLMPLSTEEGEQSSDLLVPMDVFSNPKSKDVHLEHELIAGRIAALLAGNLTRVWSATTQAYEQVEEIDEPVVASEIMILVHSRTHVPDLIRRLQNRGIPVAADRQGSLLDRPIVQPLMATLNLIANPQSRSAVLGLARSPVLGFTDGQIEAMMAATPEHTWWTHMAEHAPNRQVGALVSHIGEMVAKGALYEAIDAILDHSDLLVAYPEDADRQNAEAWYMLVASIGNELGHEAAAIYSRLCELHRLGQRGPPATTVPAGGAVRIMTVHNAKGLEASVVFAAGLFKAGASDSQLNSRENILVTPQVVAGRINPWRSQDRPNDGLWEFTQRLDQAQTQAERRRSFYVALTRARDRLILVGSYANDASINADTGEIEVKVKASRSTMGGMLLESLRSLAYEAHDEHAPWLLEGDYGANELPFYDKRTLSLDPYSLLHNSHLGPSAIQSMRLYHHPDCFETTQVTTPLQDWTALEQRIDAIESESGEAAQPLAVGQSVRMTAHGLDTSSACPRRHWLTEVKGWIPEQLKMFGASETNAPSSSQFPPATSFGTMMHRLVELGLANPSKAASPHSTPLPEAWRFDGDDGLDNPEIIANVLGEEGYSVSEDSKEHDIAIRTHERMGVLGRLVRKGLLGRLAAGETHNGLTVEGLRTELPFYHRHPVAVDGIERSNFSIQGAIPKAVLSELNLIFDGRADLVLALRDEHAEGFLQVVDLKTKDCRDGFNPTNPSKGTPLQQYDGDHLNPYPSTPSERSILDEHRLQLTLYSMALQAVEATKPSDQQRRILPPALLVGASGRMLQLTVEEFEESQQALNEHLQWIGHLAAAPQSLEEPNRLSSDASEPCQTCPFYRGDVRLCAPAGEALGLPLPIEED